MHNHVKTCPLAQYCRSLLHQRRDSRIQLPDSSPAADAREKLVAVLVLRVVTLYRVLLGPGVTFETFVGATPHLRAQRLVVAVVARLLRRRGQVVALPGVPRVRRRLVAVLRVVRLVAVLVDLGAFTRRAVLVAGRRRRHLRHSRHLQLLQRGVVVLAVAVALVRFRLHAVLHLLQLARRRRRRRTRRRAALVLFVLLRRVVPPLRHLPVSDQLVDVLLEDGRQPHRHHVNLTKSPPLPSRPEQKSSRRLIHTNIHNTTVRINLRLDFHFSAPHPRALVGVVGPGILKDEPHVVVEFVGGFVFIVEQFVFDRAEIHRYVNNIVVVWKKQNLIAFPTASPSTCVFEVVDGSPERDRVLAVPDRLEQDLRLALPVAGVPQVPGGQRAQHPAARRQYLDVDFRVGGVVAVHQLVVDGGDVQAAGALSEKNRNEIGAASARFAPTL
jgi:hypothetical protein